MATRIYHITDLRNLAAIENRGGLTCLNVLRKEGVAYSSIAFDSVQDRRATKRVPCGPGGYLHDYVPFYFAPRSPMLYTISKGNVPTCPNGQRDVVYLVSSVEGVKAYGARYVFTDGHGVVAMTRFFDDPGRLGEIDWATMRSKWWNDTNDDPDRSRRRQAEFLVHSFFPLQLVEGIAVMRQNQIAKVCASLPSCKDVEVQAIRGWYY